MLSSEDSPEKPLNLIKGHWDLASAVRFLQSMQERAHAAGWNLALCGGVLNNGYSHNDLDVMAVPRSAGFTPDRSFLFALFNPIPEAAGQTLAGPRRSIQQCRPFKHRPVVELIIFDQ